MIPQVVDIALEDFFTEGLVLKTSRDVLTLVGSEAVKFAHAMLSQDLSSLDLAENVGKSCWAFLLDQQGKAQALIRVTKLDEQTLVLDSDSGCGEIVDKTLRRYLMRTKATLTNLGPKLLSTSTRELDETPFPNSWSGLSDGGPSDGDGNGGDADSGDRKNGVVKLSHFGSSSWYQSIYIGSDPAFDASPNAVHQRAFEQIRVWSGVPCFPNEIDGDILANATGLDRVAISFTKGCYLGQETVERIDSRAVATPNRLYRGIVRAIDPRDSETLNPDGETQKACSVALYDAACARESGPDFTKPLGMLTSVGAMPTRLLSSSLGLLPEVSDNFVFALISLKRGAQEIGELISEHGTMVDIVAPVKFELNL